MPRANYGSHRCPVQASTSKHNPVVIRVSSVRQVQGGEHPMDHQTPAAAACAARRDTRGTAFQFKRQT
jgi:hypothetical protein